MARRGKFITIEGGEGAGKSVFCKLLRKQLELKGVTIITSHEPGGTPTGDEIRRLFKNPFEDDPLLPMTELLLVSAARSQHIGQKLKPAVEAGSWVLCDRYFDSTRVYQGLLSPIPENVYESVIASSVDGFEPDLTILLDCPTDVAFERVRNRSLNQDANDEQPDRFDNADCDFHEKLRHSYLEIAKKYSSRILKMDATASSQVLVDKAIQAIEERFGKFGNE